jgi:ATP-dependent Clp protease ATP-binding subunit ClpC
LAEETLLVVEAAGLTARAMGHDHIGTQHLLVALLVCNTAAAQALEGLGLDAEPLREACRSATRLAAKQPAMTELPSTPAVRRAIARAATEAGNRNHSTARAAHLLMAMLREPENEAVQRLLDLGISPQEAEQRVEVAIRFLEGVMAKDESLTRTPR